MALSQSDAVRVSRQVEVTEGVVITNGDRDQVLHRGYNLTAEGGDPIRSDLIDGSGEVQDQVPGPRAVSATHPGRLAYQLFHPEMEDVLRGLFPLAEVTITGANITADPAGTHQDGITGPVLTAPATTFANLVTYNGATVNGAQGLMLESTGWGTDNDFPRAIKAVSDTQIDLEPAYVLGTAGNPGAPLLAATATPTLRVGAALRNGPSSDSRTINVEINYSDQPTGSYQVGLGLRGSTLTLNISEQGLVELNFGYVGLDYSDMVTASVLGTGTLNANAAASNALMRSDGQLSYMLLNGTRNISCELMTAFVLEFVNGAQGVDGVSGCDARKTTTTGTASSSGSWTLYNDADHAHVITNWGRAGTQIPVDIKFVDTLGNFYWIRQPRVLVGRGILAPGEQDSLVQGQVPYAAAKNTAGPGTLIIQAFAAP